ncbi:unnamed protein product [Rotaria sp. Silwood1]|nr:unnamed protein product [Rotaria sp. Silwood1]CAF3353598.1 unnamed protein product [Rotaria sp. Silwood1]CAF3354425.1 unnamed protein product [Rotaria sp. Silwood1]CAF3359052.1 unnamed protein product [Rotaria sp. Silwood1]CAF5027822.1 unnamed protein product [Rotaria sp. Silwood1]
MASSDKTIQMSTKPNALLDKFNAECTNYLQSELNIRLLSSSSSATNKSVAFEHYLAEYQQCIDEQINFVNYTNEQIALLDALKSYEIMIDKFLERLKSTHEYELKQNEVFEQILHELTKINPSSKDERIRLIEQIDELIAYKAKIIDHTADNKSTTNKLIAKSSDTFKNIL